MQWYHYHTRNLDGFFRSLTITQFSLQQNLGSSAKVWCKGSLMPSMVEFGCCNHFRPSGDKKEVGSLVGTLKIEAPLKSSNFGWLFGKNPSCHCCFVTRPQKNPNPSEKKKKNMQPFFWGTLKPIMGLWVTRVPMRSSWWHRNAWRPWISDMTWTNPHNFRVKRIRGKKFHLRVKKKWGFRVENKCWPNFLFGGKKYHLGNQLRSRHGQKCALAAVMLRIHEAWLPRKIPGLWWKICNRQIGSLSPGIG